MEVSAQSSLSLQSSTSIAPLAAKNSVQPCFSHTTRNRHLETSKQTWSSRLACSPCKSIAGERQGHQILLLGCSSGFSSISSRADDIVVLKTRKSRIIAKCTDFVGFPEVAHCDRRSARDCFRNSRKCHGWHHHRRKEWLEKNTLCKSQYLGDKRFRIEGMFLQVQPQNWHPLTPFRRPRVGDIGGACLRRFHQFCTPPNSRDTPPQRAIFLAKYGWEEGTGIGSEQEWGISLETQPTSEAGLNEDGSTWYRESGEDLGDSGYRCRWTVMGGRNADGSVEWKETWWEKSDKTGYKELGAEKSGRNAQGDSWWETWQEIYRKDEWSGLARIEKNAHKQAKSWTGGVWNEKWWEKHNTKGWAEKGAHKYGRLNDQSWWEKWGEQYDGRGAVIKWTDKWAESDSGTKWGDKWEEKFNEGIGTRQGETWHVSSAAERWSRTWGEEHFGNGEVHKYGRSTSGEVWDTRVKEPTHYDAEPKDGWAEAVARSNQLLAISHDFPPAPST